VPAAAACSWYFFRAADDRNPRQSGASMQLALIYQGLSSPLYSCAFLP
jgi:hypothetical protein